jgi:hypothetical protein
VSGNQKCSVANGYPVQRCFVITPTTVNNASIKFYYTYAELISTTVQTPSSLHVWHYSSGSWDDRGNSASNATCVLNSLDCFIQANIIAYSPFALENNSPLAVNLSSFSAVQAGDHNTINWETASELKNLGFNLWRGTTASGPTEKLNSLLIPSQAPGGTDGFAYSYDDFNIASNTIYFYWLEDVDLQGVVTRHGPVSTANSGPSAVTLIDFKADQPATNVGVLIALALISLIGVVTVLRLRRKDARRSDTLR